MRRRGMQPRLISPPRLHRPGHFVVDFQDHPRRAVLAVGRLVLAFDNREGVQNVGHVVALDGVEVEEGRVQLAAQEEAPLFVPAEGRRGLRVMSYESCVGVIGGQGGQRVLGERGQIPGRVGEFQNAGQKPSGERDWGLGIGDWRLGIGPGAGLGVGFRRENGELLGNVKIEMRAPDAQPRHIITSH